MRGEDRGRLKSAAEVKIPSHVQVMCFLQKAFYLIETAISEFSRALMISGISVKERMFRGRMERGDSALAGRGETAISSQLRGTSSRRSAETEGEITAASRA